MLINKIVSKNIPNEFFVVIEITKGSPYIKYEFDKTTNMLFVDRILNVAMYYPYNYGFIPNTMADDDDPIDVLVITEHSIIPGAVINCRPIGALIMEDESGLDEKIIAVPVSNIDKSFDKICSIFDLHQSVNQKIEHFFRHYKDLEKNKWVKIIKWIDEDLTKNLLKTYHK